MAYLAIVTKRLNPTAASDSRIKATVGDSYCYTPWDDSLSAEQNHIAARNKLAQRLLMDEGWHWAAGLLPDGSWAHVMVRQRS